MQAVASDVVALTNESTSEPNFTTLFQQYQPRIYNYLRYRVNSVEDAEDLLSTIFEQAFTHRHRFDPLKGAFSTWLFRIARNTLISHYRKRKSRASWETDAELPADLVSPEPSLESQLAQKESILQILHGLEKLSERDQEIISLKFAGRLSNKEIGEILKMKDKTVSVALLRAVRRLRQQVNRRPRDD